jgi:tetratricopeptide (TPR) repeat protein
MRLSPSSALLFLLSLALLTIPVAAQKGGSGPGRGGSVPGSVPASMAPPYRPTNSEEEFKTYDTKHAEEQKQQLKNELPGCFRFPMSPVLSGTVSVGRMEIPDSARDEFDRACGAVHKNDLNEAQKRLSKAVKTAPKYAAAWTLLGQTQLDQRQAAQAVESCGHARTADPNYVPAYLCLADIAAHQEKWSDVAELTSQAAALHPVRAPGIYYYNCVANYYLRHWDEAEKSGLRAVDDAGKSPIPQVHWLLAKVYEQKGDRMAEAAQIREFLRLAPHDPDAEAARHVLNQIDSQPSSGVQDGQKPPEKK